MCVEYARIDQAEHLHIDVKLQLTFSIVTDGRE